MTPSRMTISGPLLAELLDLDPGHRPRYAGLAHAIRDRILSGHLGRSVRLPAERELAAALRLSRTSVTAAYDRLRADGYLVSRRGAGSWTALPGDDHVRPGTRWEYPGTEVTDLAMAAGPATAQLPAALAAAAELLPAYLTRHGYYPAGIPELRAAVAARYTERGLATLPSQIVVTGGAQHAFSLLLRLLISPGDRVVVESPTYPHALDAVRRAGGHLVPVGLDPVRDPRWPLELAATAMRTAAARLFYTIPEYQNPAGLLMDDQQRAELVESARRAGTLLVADETYEAVAIAPPERAPRPMAGFDHDGRVLSIGSLSKLGWGGLRVGWIRAPSALVDRVVALRAGSDIAGAVLDQLVATQLLACADAMRAERRAALTLGLETLSEALKAWFPAWRWRPPTGGMTLWVELDAPIGTALVEAARRHDLYVVPGAWFVADGVAERYLRLPFTQSPPALRAAVERLAMAAAEVAGEVAGDADTGPRPGRPELPLPAYG